MDRGARLLVLSDRGVDAGPRAHSGLDGAWGPCTTTSSAPASGCRRRSSSKAASRGRCTTSPRLLGYGASAVYPYLALGFGGRLALQGGRALPLLVAQERYRKAVEDGLLKVMAKMGISTLDSYIGAQIFEAVGLAGEVIRTCFPGTPSVVQGNGFRHIAEVVLAWHSKAYPVAGKPDTYGFYKPRKGGEHHDFTPESAKKLHEAVMLGEKRRGGRASAGDAYERVGPDGRRPAQPAAVGSASFKATARPFRWTTWSRWRRSSGAFPRRQCRSAPFRRKPTRCWPSP